MGSQTLSVSHWDFFSLSVSLFQLGNQTWSFSQSDLIVIESDLIVIESDFVISFNFEG